MPDTLTRSFRSILEAAVNDLSSRGFVSRAQVEQWLALLRSAAGRELGPDHKVDAEMKNAMDALFRKLIERGRVVRFVPEVGRYTLAMLAPGLRAELDKRILAAADLIKINRREAIEKTLQRFSGWATSIPPGGEGVIDKREVRAHVAKSLQQQRYQKRVVQIDQGHKLVSNIAELVATGNGAIAAEWNHVHQAGYDARPAHVARDGHVLLVRDSWAHKAGLVKPGRSGYVDEIERPGELVFCFPGDTEVPFARDVEIAYRRWYSGQLTEIVTDEGKTLRATPNHPVLTVGGWKPIGALDDRDYVLQLREERRGLFEEDQDEGIASIGDLYCALAKTGVSRTASLSPADFHGDGSNGNVDIVSVADRSLSIGRQSGCTQAIDQFCLTDTAENISALRLAFNFVIGAGDAAASFVRFCSDFLAPSAAFVGHPQSIGLRTPAKWDRQLLGQRMSRYTKLLGQPQNTFASEIAACRVVLVENRQWSGHVYNLQTAAGWYSANGIIAHNCRCWYRFILSPRRLPDSMLTRAGQEWIAAGEDRAAA